MEPHHRSAPHYTECAGCRGKQLRLSGASETRQDLADRPAQHGVGERVHLGRFRVPVTIARPGSSRAARRRRWVDRERRANREQQVASCAARSARRRSSRDQVLPNEIVAVFEDAAAAAARGVLFARAHARERAFHGARSPQSMHITSRSVPWISTMPRARCRRFCVQTVDVLRDQRVELAAPFEQRRARGGRRWARAVRSPSRGAGARRACAPRARPGSAQRGHLLRPGILGPEPLRPAEVRDAGSVEMPAPVSRAIRCAAEYPLPGAFARARVRDLSSRYGGRRAMSTASLIGWVALVAGAEFARAISAEPLWTCRAGALLFALALAARAGRPAPGARVRSGHGALALAALPTPRFSALTRRRGRRPSSLRERRGARRAGGASPGGSVSSRPASPDDLRVRRPRRGRVRGPRVSTAPLRAQRRLRPPLDVIERGCRAPLATTAALEAGSRSSGRSSCWCSPGTELLDDVIAESAGARRSGSEPTARAARGSAARSRRALRGAPQRGAGGARAAPSRDGPRVRLAARYRELVLAARPADAEVALFVPGARARPDAAVARCGNAEGASPARAARLATAPTRGSCARSPAPTALPRSTRARRSRARTPPRCGGSGGSERRRGTDRASWRTR